MQERKIIEMELEKIYEAEELYWQQRGGEKWTLEGDANTNFFHLAANGRRRKKSILSLEDNGEVVNNPKQIHDLIYGYYKKLFGKKNQNTVNLADSVWGDYNRLNELDNTLLTRPFTEEEVNKVVFSMHPDSAPGPDGFSIAFYHGCWEIIKQDLMNMVNDFYLGKLDIKRLNYGVITLIPKVKNAMDVKQYRPICLLNVSFKIFTKLLLDRLEGVVDKLISNSQTTFIKGRYILDGAVILHETLHELSQKKLKGVVMKIDFEKAYDSINWNFVEGVLIRKGFSPKLTEWIMSTVRGG